MVSSPRPLQEKLTLFWHDHFATTDQDTPMMLAQNRTLRRHALGAFPVLLREVTTDPAMLLHLSLANSDPEAPNENFARELMELFTLARGYTERDIREAARALTGFRADWNDDGSVRTYYDREYHDSGRKRIFGKRGRFDWRDVLDARACATRAHAPFLVEKLWDFFVGHADPARHEERSSRAPTGARGTASSPSSARSSPTRRSTAGSTSRPWSRPRSCSSPARCAASGRASSATPGAGCSRAWASSSFRPPSVAGWEWGTAWLSSNSMHIRFDAANYLLDTPKLAGRGRVDAGGPVAGAARSRAPGAPSASPGPRARPTPS